MTARPIPPQPSTPMSTPGAPPAPSLSPEITQTQLLSDLRKLDELHRRLIGLRTAIPAILHPLRAHYATPVDMFTDFSTRAHSCSEDIATFNQMYVAATPVFERAQAEFKRRPGMKVGRLAAADMFLPEEDAGGEGLEGGQEEVKEDAMEQDGVELESACENTPAERVGAVLEEWKAENPEVGLEKLSADGAEKALYRITVPLPASMGFTLEITPPDITTTGAGADAQSRQFMVTAVRSERHPDAPALNIHTSILRSIGARSNAGNLRMLLDMIVEYRMVYTTKCDKCGKLATGSRVELPVVRKLQAAKEEGAEGKKRWVALHEACS
ncbi:hypothetical protein EDC01DRAFT_672697 [Geopyxis carbonaria]|nr:hypothetical protein EDC01DRAFT_672697 [Geopyxis carbonaria]